MTAAIPSQLPANKQYQILNSNVYMDCVFHPTSDPLELSCPADVIDNPLFFKSDATDQNIFKHMKSECNRLYSFQNKWPVGEITPESLAEAGFFYLQQEDLVQCPFCGIKISDWIRKDKPLREHMRKSPRCHFLMGCDVGNVPLVSLERSPEKNSVFEKKYLPEAVSVSYKPKHPRMADLKRRILTFSNWPLQEPAPQRLAECGLYYSGVADVVTCFFCGGGLGNWDPNDDPWDEHAQFFPDCAFLAVAKKRHNHSSKVSAALKQTSKESAALKQKSKESAVSNEGALDKLPSTSNVNEVNPENGESKDNNAPYNSDVLLCKVCMDKERSAVFQPCGHFVSCWNCANLIFNCPVCRRSVTHRIRTYVS